MSGNYNNKGGFNLGDRIKRGLDAISIKNANNPQQVADYDNKHPDQTQNYGGGLLGRIRTGIGSFLGPGKPR